MSHSLDRTAAEAALRAGASDVWRQLTSHVPPGAVPQLSAAASAQIIDYLACLLVWREKISLVATGDPIELVERHVVDSLAVAPFLEPGWKVVDVGSGAGFPGVPLAVVRPESRIVLVEPRRKRANFLRAAVRAARLTNAEVVEARIEEAGIDAVQAVTSRAVGGAGKLVEAAAASSAPGGSELLRVVAMKGPAGPTETGVDETPLGAPRVVGYRLRDGTARTLLIFDRFPSACQGRGPEEV